MARFRETVAGALLACALMAIAPAAASCAEPAEPSEEIICVGDSCQVLPPEPEDPTPGTLVPNPGNPPRHFDEPKKHGKKHHRKGGHGKRRGARQGARSRQ